jgi:hypothetical protein
MSFLKDFSPKRTRKIKSEPQKDSLPEVHSSPVQEIKRNLPPEIQENLIDQYSYKADEAKIKKQKTENENENKTEDYFRAIAQKEQSAQKKTFGFHELSLQCEEHLVNYLWGPQDLKFKKIYELERDYINKKLVVLAEYKKEVSFGRFKDNLYYYKGEVLIPEEYLSLTGFLREYFQLEKVAVLYLTGEILLIKTKYCNFWFKDRLSQITEYKLSLTKTEIIDDDSCLDCIFNWNCPFARVQQMSN